MKAKRFYVFAEIAEQTYFSTVKANNTYEAEHLILDMGVCSMSECAVNVCVAFDETETDYVMRHLQYAKPISLKELTEIIKERNEYLLKKEETLDLISSLKREIEELTEELKYAEEELANYK